jgi:NAD(P)-dependent dehydrogenase (short-subunit alcohol dehydrogenase family)
MSDNGSAVIIGVGPGLGAALSRRFAAGGLKVAMAARGGAEKLDPIVKEIEDAGGTARAFAVDATDEDAVKGLFDAAEADLGPVAVAIHNAGFRIVKPILEMEADDIVGNWRSCCLGGFLVGREAARRMVPRGVGSILFTGGRGSRRALPELAAFAIAKGGVRMLAESMARELGPKGIHVAHFAIEGTIMGERTKGQAERLGPDGLVEPEALAETYYRTHLQPRSAWSFEVDIRPWGEGFI